MFRRPRQPTPPVVTFDLWAGDTQAPALRRALEAGDVASVAAAYAAADRHRREFLAHVVTETMPPPPALETWPDRDPGSAVASLFRGTSRIFWAWEERGAGYASTVAERSWDIYFERLRAAEADLRRAAQMDDDGAAWSMLLISGRGLQVGLDEQWARYDRATEVTPDLPFAADQLLQALCAKWSGSHDAMFDFARSVVAKAPDGDPRMRLIASAHLERGFDFRDDIDGRNRYRDDRDVQAELIAAAERSVFRRDFGSTPQHRVTFNTFAVALCYFRRFDVARPLLELIGANPTKWPWAYWEKRAEGILQGYREKAGLPPLRR